MSSQSTPKANNIELLKDNFLLDIKNQILSGLITNTSKKPFAEFLDLFRFYVNTNSCFKLENLELFPVQEIMIGCHHYIDSVLISNGISNVQVLEHEYKYYERLNPQWQWAKVGQLKSNTDLIIATPFPGYLDIHPEFNFLLDEALEKNINIHIDGAWLSCSKGITIDLSHPSIKSIGISLSKGYAANWNRVGVRFMKNKNPSDPITIFNNANMCPESVVRNGISLLEHVPIDYMWNKYGASYEFLVRKYDLEPGKILFAAYGKDRIIYSLSHLLIEMENEIGESKRNSKST